jgi:hypothetical protein
MDALSALALERIRIISSLRPRLTGLIVRAMSVLKGANDKVATYRLDKASGDKDRTCMDVCRGAGAPCVCPALSWFSLILCVVLLPLATVCLCVTDRPVVRGQDITEPALAAALDTARDAVLRRSTILLYWMMSSTAPVPGYDGHNLQAAVAPVVVSTAETLLADADLFVTTLDARDGGEFDTEDPTHHILFPRTVTWHAVCWVVVHRCVLCAC